MKVESESEVAKSCPTPCDTMDYSLPGSSDHGIFHARVLEWSATAFSVMNNGIHVSLSILVSSGYMTRNGIAGFYGGFIPSF